MRTSMQFLTIASLKNALMLLVSAVISLTVAGAAPAALLFSDNFNSPDSTDINTDVALVGRQGGTLAPLTYTVEPGLGNADARIIGNSLAINQGFAGECCSGTAEVIINHNFAPTIGSAGGFTVKYQMNPGVNTGFFGFGYPTAAAANSLTSEEFAFSFADATSYTVYANGVAQTVGPIPGAHNATNYSIEVIVTTADFNNATPGTVAIILDGNHLDMSNALGFQGTRSFTWDAEVANYIAWGMDQAISVFVDNIEISTAEAEVVPEPSTLVLAALGLAGLGVVAWRRRK